MRWREYLYIIPTKEIHRGLCFYHGMVIQLVHDHVRFHPYRQYLAWDELEVKLIGIHNVRILNGQQTKFLEYFNFESIKHQFGLVQDVILKPRRYQREGTLPMEGIEPLVYAEPNIASEEAIEEGVDDDDVSIIKVFVAQWQEELKKGDQGH